MNFHNATGDERGIGHGTWVVVHGRGREESYVRAWEKEGAPLFKIKSETKNFLTLTNVNRATWAGSPAKVSKLLCVGMLLCT